jgi:hypothetical protein
MDTREFKSLFAEVAKAHGFHAAHGGWYQELPAALFVLNLQKSNFGNYYELNLKFFLSRKSPDDSAALKKLIKNQSGDIFRRQPEDFRIAFDLDAQLSVAERRAALDEMFCSLVDRMISAATDSAGILRLRDQGVLFVLPMIEARLKAS